MRKLYLDNAATTQVYDKVAREMQKYLIEDYGNPSSLHKLGDKAKLEMDKARSALARVINARPWEILFTSGGTESNNLAIFGLARANKNKKKRTIIISSIEHPSVGEGCKELEKQGYNLVKISVNKEGIIDINYLERELRKNKDVLLVSVMHVNNIIGTINDISKIGEMCRKYSVLFHTDAVQSFGKLEIDVKKMNIDLLSASGHKIGAAKGVGFLFVREGIKIKPLIFGGGQEKGLRSGTENIPAIVSFGKALEIQKKINKNKIRKIRDKMIIELEKIGGKINGPVNEHDKRIYNNIHVSFPGLDNSTLVIFLSQRGIYVSAGSACDSTKEKEDHVLKAIGLNRQEQKGSIRITLNEAIKERDINFIVKEIDKAVKKLRIN